jgi:hypothetical protein
VQFGGKHLGKHLLGRPRRRWKDNTKMDLGEIDCENLRWRELPQHHFQWQVNVKSLC